MHLGKFHAAVTGLVKAYSVHNVNGLIESVIQHLDAMGSNPGNADIAKAFKTQLELLRTALVTSSLNKPYPTLAALLDSIDARPFTGELLFQRIENLIAANGMTPQLAAAALRDFLSTVVAFYKNLSQIDTAFTNLGVEFEELEPGQGEIGISIPEPEGERLLSDLAKTAKNWNKALRPFVELADRNHNPVTVRYISSSDWQFYLTAAPAVYLALSAAVSQVNDLLRKLIETRQLVSQLISNGVSENATATVAAEADSMLDTRTRELAEKIVESHQPEDAGRANELKTEVTASLKFIAREMAANVTIEVRFLPPVPPPPTEVPTSAEETAEIVRIGELTEAAAQIARNMDLLRLDPKAKELLNLPAPDEDIEKD